MTINTVSQLIIRSPIGNILISLNGDEIDGIELFTSSVIKNEIHSEIQLKIMDQFTAYFKQAHNNWSLDLVKKGTPFQRQVWQYLHTISVGKTKTYSDIASALSTSPRAVANACRANPFAIVIPCHRVVAKTGLGGYYGKTIGKELNVKQWLLDHEKS